MLALTIVVAAWAPWSWSDEGQDDEPVLLVTGEWPPFTSQDMDGSGYFTAVVTQVFERMDQPYEVRFMPWKRTMAMIEKGEAFATFPYRITDQRQQKHTFSRAVTTSSGRLFYLDSRFPNGLQWQDYGDLKDYKIGGTLGYWYEAEFRRADLDSEFVRSDEVN
ncbi:MAG: substrate-binding periplasmic protein, partial [Pseudomonadota bacterium]